MNDFLQLDNDSDFFTQSDFEDESEDFLANLEENPVELNKFPEFNCIFEDSSEIIFNKNGFINALDVENFKKNSEVQNDLKLFGLSIHKQSLMSKDIVTVLFKKARMSILKIQLSTENGKKLDVTESFHDLRLEVRTFLHIIRMTLDFYEIDFIKNCLKSLRDLFGSLDSISEFLVMHSSNKAVHYDSASFNFLHLQLEWRWIYLTILLKIEMKENPIWEDHPVCGIDFERELQLYMFDLMLISLCKFNGQNRDNLFQISSFTCKCFNESWLLIQLLTEKLALSNKQISFWDVFNKSLMRVQQDISLYEEFENMEIILRRSYFPFPNNKSSHYLIWILLDIAKLQGYSQNGNEIGKSHTRVQPSFDIVETILKKFLISDPPENELRSFLILIAPLLNEFWPPSNSSLFLLWEFFNKKINLSFSISGASLDSLAVICSSGLNYLNNIKTQMTEKLNLKQTSFTMFLNILGSQLIRFNKMGQKNQILKIFGRVISKFSPAKILGLSEGGIHNVITLFVTLSLTTNLKEVNIKIQEILLQSPLESMSLANKANVMKGHAAMLLLFTEQEIDLSLYISRVIGQLNSISKDLNPALPVMKILIDGLIEIFNRKQGFELGAHNFLDNWILKYLQECTSSERDRFIKSLTSNLIEIQEIAKTSKFVEQNYSKIIELFFRYTLPTVKKMYIQEPDAIWMPESIANLCICATGINTIPKFEDLFKFFLENNCPNIQTTIKFLNIVLSSHKIETIDIQTIMMAWLKCLIVSTTTTDELREVTRIVIGLEGFDKLCSIDGEQIVAAKDPLYVFFTGVAQKYQSCQDINEKFEIADKIEKYLVPFKRWNFNNEQSPEKFMRMYQVIAIIILHCSEIVFNRAKASCFFNVSISTYILPISLLTGKPQSEDIIKIIHKIWHVIMEGIGKLNFKNDPNLLMNATDLIVKWTPLFRISSNSKIVARPFVNCFNNNNNNEISGFILQTLSSNFIILENRQPHIDACLVVTIFNELFLKYKHDESKMKILLENVSLATMEHAMMLDEFKPSRKLILIFLTNLLQSSTFKESIELQEIITVNMKTLTSKYMAPFAAYYFQFLKTLVKLNSQVVRELMSHVRNELTEFEEDRGNGRNLRLREYLESIEKSL